mgnify:CR=1 FL=1
MALLHSGIQWDKVCRLASQQTLVGLLADGIRMLPAGCGPEEKLYRQLQAYVVRNIQAHNLITERLGRTLQVLREEGKRTTARNLLELGVDMDTIVKATGLTREEILAE